ncbi:hypothetical protein [Paraburkholderia sp. JHI869]|uniref:hypothetical protein n=1 Tax=Paraburkholderia sp. JHI869 TaxID=3112959 RepID=UPI00317BD8CF
MSDETLGNATAAIVDRRHAPGGHWIDADSCNLVRRLATNGRKQQKALLHPGEGLSPNV